MTSVAPPRGGRGGRQKGRRTTWVDAPIELPVDDAPRRGRFSRLARPLLTSSTMVAVLAMAVVTSVPANAFLGDAATTAAVPAAVAAPAQHLAAVTADTAAITRDAYSVTDPVPIVVAAPSGGTTVVNVPAAIGRSSVRWPFNGEVRRSDPFGPRVSPCSGCSTMHLGTDFLPGEGNPVLAMADGVVTKVETTGGLGYHVTIEHMIDGQLVTTTSAHMQAGSIVVSAGQQVHAGDMIGRVGNTGASTGAHLHFELRLGGTDPVDAYIWISQHLR